MGMTMAEKVLARASGKESVKAGDYVIADVDLVMHHDPTFNHLGKAMKKAGIPRVNNPEKVAVVSDHFVPATTVDKAENFKKQREFTKAFGIKHFYDWNVGVCHQVIPEKGLVLPGDLVVGTDSHTGTYGALGAASAAISGEGDALYAMVAGKLWFKVPETIKIILEGSLAPYVSSKDVMIYLAGKLGDDFANYKSLEFTGSAAHEMSIASRLTMSNMGVEVGAKFTMFESDDKTIEFLKGRTNRKAQLFCSDEDAEFEQIIEIDVSEIEPQIAVPDRLSNAVPVSEIDEVKIDQVFIGSCTNGRLEDLQIAAELLRGKKVCPDTRLLVIPASAEIYGEALKQGLLEVFYEAGARIEFPSCGPCMGSHFGLIASGEKCLSTTNRNFKGRMGSTEGEVYLSSPATAAATALTGIITDPRKVMA